MNLSEIVTVQLCVFFDIKMFLGTARQLCYFLNFNISLMLKSAIFLFMELAYLDKANKLTPFDGASQYGSGTLSYDGGNSNPSKNSGFFILNPLNLDDGSTVPTAF